MAIKNYDHKRDSNLESGSETSKVPLNKHPYNPSTNANQKMDLSSGGKNVNLNIPPGGRTPTGYGNSHSIGGPKGGVGAHKVVNNEGNRTVARTRAVGRVIKSTDHPNSKINGIYG